MNLRTLAEIATVGAFVLAIFALFQGNQNALDRLPKDVQPAANKAVEELDLSLPQSKLGEPASPALGMMRAAQLMTSSVQKDAALAASVAAALSENDFKVALAATKAMSSSISRNHSLSIIATEAMKTPQDIGYAIVAAELATSSLTRNEILTKVVSALNASHSESLKNETGTPEADDKDKVFKEIFLFASSISGINLSRSNALTFTEEWIANRSFEEFQYFRDVFLFANSISGVNLSRDKAMEFAFKFIPIHSRNEFSRVKDVFIFASSISGMNMNRDEAIKYALDKIAKEKIPKL